MDEGLNIPSGVLLTIVGFIASGIVTVFVWAIKSAAAEILDGFKKTMEAHSESIIDLGEKLDAHRRQVEELKITQAEFNARLKVLEIK